jgi:hypothetical protein
MEEGGSVIIERTVHLVERADARVCQRVDFPASSGQPK